MCLGVEMTTGKSNHGRQTGPAPEAMDRFRPTIFRCGWLAPAPSRPREVSRWRVKG
jgi:hypothetical protein